MCYIRNIKPLMSSLGQKWSPKEEESNTIGEENSIDPPSTDTTNQGFVEFVPATYQIQQNLNKLLKYINSNSILLNQIENKVSHNQRIIEKLEQETILSERTSSLQLFQESKINLDKNINPQNQHSLVQQLFGVGQYQYRILLNKQFSNVIYKERNISLDVQLVNSDGKYIRNSNMLNLCLDVCDNQGEWITQNKVGSPFMKGKIEVDLYHGKASFIKVYPRDVSRKYPAGVINFIIYAKPCILKCMQQNNSFEQIVNHYQIEPLVIPNVYIKAKKTQ